MRCIYGVDEIPEVVHLPIRHRLTGAELDVAVAVQLKLRAEQGFGEISPRVLARVAEIVRTARCELGSSEATACSDDHEVRGKAA